MKLIRSTIAATLAACALISAVAQPAELGPEVTIATGTVRGAARDAIGVLAFKGMPYAAPPVGHLHWRSPQPALKWSGAADPAFSETLTEFWVDFATKGDPNGPGLPLWPAYRAGGPVQELGTSIAPRANPQLERLRFVASFSKHGVFPAGWRGL